MTDPTTAPGAGTVQIDEGDLATLLHEHEELQEALSDVLRTASAGALDLLRRDEAGWSRIGGDIDEQIDEQIDRERLLAKIAEARIMAVADPLIKRGLLLRSAYVWGRGVTINAAQEDGSEQDVDAVVQGFLDDPSNRDSFSSLTAHQAREKAFGTDGNVIITLITDPVTGRVQVRPLRVGQIVGRVTNPEDEAEVWLYRREWRAQVVEAGTLPSTTRTRWETRRAYYPSLGFSPSVRAKSVDGIPVEWDKPVLHVAVNALGWLGVPDAYASLPWAVGYADFLSDWARIARALSRIAFQATAKTKAGAAQVRQRLGAATVDHLGQGPAGQTAIVGEGQRLEAIGKSGATIDSQSGLPLAAMVGSALGVPVTILTANPTTTGARATADTLDPPLRAEMKMRQDLHADLIRRVLDYVIDQAIKAPSGPLRGTARVDRVTGREVIELAGGQSRAIEVDFPDASETPLAELMAAIERADGMDLLPPLTVARLALLALEVPNVDDVLAQITDEHGDFKPPARGGQSAYDAVAQQPGTQIQPPADQPPTDQPAT